MLNDPLFFHARGNKKRPLYPLVQEAAMPRSHSHLSLGIHFPLPGALSQPSPADACTQWPRLSVRFGVCYSSRSTRNSTDVFYHPQSALVKFSGKKKPDGGSRRIESSNPDNLFYMKEVIL